MQLKNYLLLQAVASVAFVQSLNLDPNTCAELVSKNSQLSTLSAPPPHIDYDTFHRIINCNSCLTRADEICLGPAELLGPPHSGTIPDHLQECYIEDFKSCNLDTIYQSTEVSPATKCMRGRLCEREVHDTVKDADQLEKRGRRKKCRSGCRKSSRDLNKEASQVEKDS